MAVCPKGHQSTADDYCDVCGARIAGAQSSGSAGASGGVTSAASGSAGAGAARSGSAARTAPTGTATCKACGGRLEDRFCERCGHDSLAPLPATAAGTDPAPVPAESSAPVVTVPPDEATAPNGPDESTVDRPAAPGTRSWLVVVSADRDYFDRVRAMHGPDADQVNFPQFFPERRFPLHGTQMLIGRRSRSRGVYPDIDLAGPPEDSAVSHTHALLIPQPDQTWVVVDLRSTNCTYLNGAAEPIAAEAPLPLHDGDHINVGAWTRLTLRST